MTVHIIPRLIPHKYSINRLRRMSQFLQDFAPGPLDVYRKRASFDWKKLKIHIHTEDVLHYEHNLYEELQNHAEYHMDLSSSSFDDERRRAARQSMAYKEIPLLSLQYLLNEGNLKIPAATTRIMMQVAPSSSVKFNVGHNMFVSVIQSLGSGRHWRFLEDADADRIRGSFSLTEIGHGSNTKGMRTIANYNKTQKQFVLHTPDFEAAKCWAAGVGQTATHSIVYAQLIIDDVCYGLHTFIVQIRDPNTLLPCPGVIVGDMGEKIGLNGIDNGFLIFDHYPIPRENLLNKNGDVNEEGKYITPFKDPSKRHGASLGALSVGRVNITGICECYGAKALTIAIRYAAVRKQFGPEEQCEFPILEYQSHQYRLLPYLSALYAIRIFTIYLVEVQYQFSIDSILGENKDMLPDLGMELHAVSSASKPVAGWTFRDAIQECREACGGHGYLKVAGIGDVKNNHDANCTYEGENHVLIQQTSNWLLKFWPAIERGEQISTPLGSANFLSTTQEILNVKLLATNIEDICRPNCILNTYQWLICYLLKQTKMKFDQIAQDKGAFAAKNDTQVYFAKNLAIAFIQHFFLQRMLPSIQNAPDAATKNVLTNLFALYGLWTLEKNLSTLYEGGYVTGAAPSQLIHGAILHLCANLKDDAVSLIDVVAPPDFILNSVLGASDGLVYKRLQSAIFRSPYAMSRPTWWQDVVNWTDNIKAKL